MGALSGQLISTLRDSDGNVVVAIVIFWDPVTRLLRNDNYTTVQDGVKNGAVIGDNPTNNSVSMVIKNLQTGNVRTISIPAKGRALTVTQLGNLTPAITTLDDVNGFSFDLSG